MVASSAPAQSADWWEAFASALPVPHVTIATLGAPFEIEVVSASSGTAARMQQAQLDLGEGPCWEAAARRTAVLIPDLGDASHESWPVARAALLALGVGSVYAFPLTVGTLDVGVVDLYAPVGDALSPADVDRAGLLARATAPEVLQHALAPAGSAVDQDLSSRRLVHQATGMVIAQLRVPAAEALLVIRGHAFAANRPVSEVAADIVERRVSFGE